MKRYTILIILIVFSYPVSICLGSENNKREWEVGHSKVVEINDNVIKVVHGGNDTTYQFDFNIYEVSPNPSRPIIFVATYDPSETGGPEDVSGAAMPPEYITGANHGCGGMVDAGSWNWVADDLLLFSGGACGSFLDYLFDVSTGKMDTYCSRLQKPGYGCPEHSFKPASELGKRIRQLQQEGVRD